MYDCIAETTINKNVIGWRSKPALFFFWAKGSLCSFGIRICPNRV